MRGFSTRLVFLVCLSFMAGGVAKDGIDATVHTALTGDADGATQVEIRWVLTDRHSGAPFDACNVFIRLVGRHGTSTEAFSRCGVDGRYHAVATVPDGGIDKVVIGVAGTTIDASGHSERSDWLFALTNDPLEQR